MERNREDTFIVAKMVEERLTVDPMLVFALRLITSNEEFKVEKPFHCGVPLTVANVKDVLRKFGVEKEYRRELKRFVVFLELKEYDVEFFKTMGIGCENESESCEELLDDYPINYEECIVLEMLYTDL
jgi:hypothetical protein